MKSILVALDGSDESLAALSQGVEWAERMGAELRTLYVVDQERFTAPPTYSDSEGSVPTRIPLEGAALKAAEEAAAKDEADVRAGFDSATKNRNVAASLQVVRGLVERTLIHAAHSVDLVVLGKRGRGLDENVQGAGPTTETVIHEAQRPVLITPKGARTTGPILIPFDGSAGVQRVVVPGVRLAAAAGAPVTVLTLASTQEAGASIQAPFREYLKPYGVQADFRVVTGRSSEREAARTILGAAGELSAGMIMMGAFSISPLREFFVGSVTREVLSKADCPILMMT